jgi:hypothetical protein
VKGDENDAFEKYKANLQVAKAQGKAKAKACASPS